MAPSNDAFASAEVISGTSGSTSGNLFDATQQSGEPAYITNDQSVWYKFTCPSSGWYKFTIPRDTHVYNGVFGSDFSYGCIALLPTGTLAQMTFANAITDYRFYFPSGPRDGVIAANLTSGVEYYIRVSSIRTGSTFNSGTFTYDLEWEQFTPPANDDFASATVVGALPATIAGTNLNSTFQSGSETIDINISNSDREQSVWYKFTPASTAKYRIAIPLDTLDFAGHMEDNPGQSQLYIQVSTGSTLATFDAAEIDRDSINHSTTEKTEASCYVDLTASTDYYIRIFSIAHNKATTDNPYNGRVYNFDLEVNVVVPPANDNYASAQVLSTTLPGSTSGTTKDATEEASEPSLPYTREQSVWYSFTPTVTGKYLFKIPLDSLVYTGYRSASNGELAISICPATGVANHTTANANALIPAYGSYDVIYKYPESGWGSPHDGLRLVDLVASTEYKIKVTSNGGSGSDAFNIEVLDFDLEWDIITAPSNDNFASAQSISGASGTQAFTCLGATAEVGEPRNFYWNDDGDGTQSDPAVWFTWTAPSSGWFRFRVEQTDLTYATYDLAIYTGAAIGALTPITKTWGGSNPGTAAPLEPATAVGFNATNGTTYKIQVTGYGAFYGDGVELQWATMSAPTGDTAATAVVGTFTGRIDNYGNTANDPPPNLTSLLSSHDNWWYNTGVAGKTKWFKYTATHDVQVRIRMQQWIVSVEAVGQIASEECGLIAYKGANYASLTVAQAYNSAISANENVAMLVESGETGFLGDYQNDVATTVHSTNPMHTPVVSLASGETLWLCVFGLYDADLYGDASVAASDLDTMEFNADVMFDFVPPVNDAPGFGSLINTPYGSPTRAYDLLKSHWGTSLIYPHRNAGQFANATTYGATAGVGEPAHAGYGPTRSVWFLASATHAGDWKFWVESSEDCVLSIYQTYPASYAALVLVEEDDDSGAGNWPECIVTTVGAQTFWVCVDSKTPAIFTLKYEWVNDSPVIPANNNFADAPVYTTPFIATGTTVGASAEYFEWDEEWNWSGPADTVWYKYTAPETKQIVIDGRVLSDNWDGYFLIEVYTGADKDHLTKVSTYNQGIISRGPAHPTFTNNEIFLNVTSGTDYYIRICTEQGSSEDYELWVDATLVPIKITPSGVDVGPWVFEVYVNIQVSSVEVYDPILETVDSGTVYVNIAASGLDAGPYDDGQPIFMDIQVSSTDFMAKDYFDATTVLIDIQIDSHDCLTKFETTQLVAHIFDRFEHVANHRWANTRAFDRFEVIAGDGLEEC